VVGCGRGSSGCRSCRLRARAVQVGVTPAEALGSFFCALVRRAVGGGMPSVRGRGLVGNGRVAELAGRMGRPSRPRPAARYREGPGLGRPFTERRIGSLNVGRSAPQASDRWVRQPSLLECKGRSAA